MSTKVKVTQRETIRQAKDHGLIVRYAEQAGLCLKDAVALANGVQLGFETVGEPCITCARIMRDWPVERANGWRSPRGKATNGMNWQGLFSEAVAA